MAFFRVVVTVHLAVVALSQFYQIYAPAKDTIFKTLLSVTTQILPLPLHVNLSQLHVYLGLAESNLRVYVIREMRCNLVTLLC